MLGHVRGAGREAMERVIASHMGHRAWSSADGGGDRVVVLTAAGPWTISDQGGVEMKKGLDMVLYRVAMDISI